MSAIIAAFLAAGVSLCVAAAAALYAQDPKSSKSIRPLNTLLPSFEHKSPSELDPKAESRKTDAASPVKTSPSVVKEGGGDSRQLSAYKDLYYKLHNLEQHSSVLPRAREQLIEFFAETISESALERPNESILKLETYDKEKLEEFMKDHDDKVNAEYEDYVARRNAGGPLELFEDKEEAKWYLKQIAPSKYVDGAWLGYINRTTLPYNLRHIVKQSWQVLSEELGDGDLSKNHTFCFRELTNSINSGLPEGDSLDFVDPKHGMNEPEVWKSALAQLLISLFPHEFFPEILGFNMQFEAITLETLRAAREIKDVGLDPYYFVLHVSIDNADSGHTAIALDAVCSYIEKVEREQGPEAAQQAWRRVQVGYNLSDSLPGKAIAPSKRKSAVDDFPRNEIEGKIVDVFQSKADAGHKVHCQSRLKIGGRRLVDWLDPAVISDKQQQMDFINHFSNLRPWIKKGDSSNSKFVHELDWGGRMFGAFTHSEVQLVREWIDTMPSASPEHYWNWTGRQRDVTSMQATNLETPSDEFTREALRANEERNAETGDPRPLPEDPFARLLDTRGKTLDQKRFFPLWFMHPCLLETFVAVPWRTTSLFACAIIRVLRAQSGFDTEKDAVAGTDESNREDNPGLVELGQEMLRHLGHPEAESLKEVLQKGDSQVADAMWHLAGKAQENKALLVGLATAFVSLHTALCTSDLLSSESQQLLEGITERERVGLSECLATFDEHQTRVCARGYWLAVEELKQCFRDA